jgi:hypothetical protein
MISICSVIQAARCSTALHADVQRYLQCAAPQKEETCLHPSQHSTAHGMSAGRLRKAGLGEHGIIALGADKSYCLHQPAFPHAFAVKMFSFGSIGRLYSALAG